MTNMGYLLIIENMLRKIASSPNEKFSDGLQLDFFTTIYEVLLRTGNIKETKKFMDKYKNYKNYSYAKLQEENFYFEHVLEDLHKFYKK